MTAHSPNPVTDSEPAESSGLPLGRTMVVRASEIRAALSQSPRTRITQRALWPLFFAMVAVGLVGAHFGKLSYPAHGVAVACLLLKLLPGIRARAAAPGPGFVEHVTLKREGIVVEIGDQRGECPWNRVSFYEWSGGLLITLPGRVPPCLLACQSFAPAEYALALELLRSRARRAGPALDFLALAVLVALAVWVGWRSWHAVP